MKKTIILVFSISMVISVNAQQELIVNGSFEQGNTGWDFSQSTDAFTGGICNAQQGSKYLWFGDSDEQGSVISVEDIVTQSFVLPSNLDHADFTFSVSGVSNEQDDVNLWDVMSIGIADLNDNIIFIESVSNADLDVNQIIPFCYYWDTHPVITIPSQYAGQTLVLVIVSLNDDSYPTLFRVDNFSVKAYATASINENKIDYITISPNPTKDFLNINNSNNENINLIFQNSLGQTISEFLIVKGDNTIDLSNYPSGVYFLKDVTGNVTRIILE